MRYEAVLPGAPLCCAAVGFAERGRPASGRGASILSGKQRGGPGASLPGLSPDVISPPRGGSAAKGQALLARFAYRGLSHLGRAWGCHVPRDPVGQGVWRAWTGKGRGMGAGRDGGGSPSRLAVPSLPSWEGGQKAVMKPDVHWASPAEQVGRDGATLAELMPATASQPPAVTFQSWTWQHGGRSDAVEKQHPASGMDSEIAQGGGFSRGLWGPWEWEEPHGTLPCPPYFGWAQGVGYLRIIWSLDQKTIQLILLPAGGRERPTSGVPVVLPWGCCQAAGACQLWLCAGRAVDEGKERVVGVTRKGCAGVDITGAQL